MELKAHSKIQVVKILRNIKNDVIMHFIPHIEQHETASKLLV